MEIRISLLSIIVIYTHLVEGEYGMKSGFNSTEDLLPSDQVEVTSNEMPPTTSDDGIMVEKAILVAEIKSETSQDLKDTKHENDGSLKSLVIEKIANEGNMEIPESFRPVVSNSPSTYGNKLNPSLKLSKNKKVKSHKKDRLLKPKIKIDESVELKETPQTSTEQYRWNNLGIHSFHFAHQQPLISKLDYSNLDNNDMDIAEDNYRKFQGNNLHEDASYYPLGNEANFHLGQEPSSNQWLDVPNTSDNYKYEDNRISQIEKAKAYIEEIQKAQEFASKANQNNYQGTLQYDKPQIPMTKSEHITPSTPKRTARPQAPGLTDFHSHSIHDLYDLSLRNIVPLPLQINALASNSFGDTSFHGPRDSQRTFSYPGPTANPIVLSSGFLADTDDVARAKLAHLQAYMDTLNAAQQWQKINSFKPWR